MSKGEKFAQGDSLEVFMEIHQVHNELVNAYLNDRYTVKEALKHIPVLDPEQVILPEAKDK